MQHECKPAECLSGVKCASNRRLISRFTTVCPWSAGTQRPLADGVHLNRVDRLCPVYKSLDCVEDEQHFVCDCLKYNHVRLQLQHLDLLQRC